MAGGQIKKRVQRPKDCLGQPHKGERLALDALSAAEVVWVVECSPLPVARIANRSRLTGTLARSLHLPAPHRQSGASTRFIPGKKSGRHCLGSPARRHGVISSLAREFPIKALCRVLGVSRSGYYAAQKKAQRPRARDNARLGAKLREAFEASRRTYGSPRLTVVLRRAGETCGRHRVARLTRVLRLRATQKRRFRPRTTDSGHLCPVAPNHLAERTAPPAKPGEVWQADITYVATHEGWLYVAGVLDACSRRVVGWAADATMPTGLVACAFERAVRGRRPTGGLLHHSDRGSQYASDAYREWLRRHGATPSMSRPANCYDNARMESFWATLKGELIGDHVFATRAEAKSALFDYIEVFYNRRRLHSALDFQSPVDYENNLS